MYKRQPLLGLAGVADDLSHGNAVGADHEVGRLVQIGQQVGLGGGLVVELAHGLPAAVAQHAINDQHGGALPLGLGRVRLGAGRLGLLLGGLRGRFGGLSRLGRLDVQDDELAGVLGAAFDFHGYADGFEHVEAFAGAPYFFADVFGYLHREQGNAQILFAVRFIAEIEFDQVNVVELHALSADECQFHSGACHVVFPRLVAPYCAGLPFSRPSGSTRANFAFLPGWGSRLAEVFS